MPVPRTGSGVAFAAALTVAEVRGWPTLHQQPYELVTPEIFPSGWLSPVILSDPGHLCRTRRPGWTPHWQATCDTTEFCRISTTCTDLDNVFFQKPGLSFKQSIILPAYQFPQDCEEGKGKKKPDPRCFQQQQRLHLGLSSGDGGAVFSVSTFINRHTGKGGGKAGG